MLFVKVIADVGLHVIGEWVVFAAIIWKETPVTGKMLQEWGVLLRDVINMSSKSAKNIYS